MTELKNDIKTFIVQRLAQFESPQKVADEVNSIFEMQVSRQQVNGLDASKPYFRASAKWKSLFFQERQRFLADLEAIPVFHKSYRLSVMQSQVDRLLRNGHHTNVPLLLSILEQAAKETGGMFTNRRELTGKDGKDLLPQQIAREVFKEMLAEGIDEREAIDSLKERYRVTSADILGSEFLDFDDDKD